MKQLHSTVFTTACSLALVALPATLLAAEDAAPVNVPQPELGAASLKIIGMLMLLIAILLGGFWLLRRYGPKGGFGMMGRGELKLEGQLALGPKKSVVVVRFLNKHLVLGVTDTSINLLTETETGDDASQTDFSQALDKARQGDR